MSRSGSMGNTIRTVDTKYQLIDPNKRVIKGLCSEDRGAFVYHKGYNLMASQSGTYSSGTLLVEWFHKSDRYVVQAVNVPERRYSSLRVQCKDLGHEVKSDTSMLLMFELRQSVNRNLFNCRVRHVPTKLEMADWDNIILPRFTIIRKGHKEMLQAFLGERLMLDGVHGGTSYQGELLKRIEHKMIVWPDEGKKEPETSVQ